MVLPRPTALRGLTPSRLLRTPVLRSSTRAVTRRGYASQGGHGGHAEPSSDLPWMIGAVAVTIPSCWYLWPEASTGAHGGHDSHEEHEEHAESDDSESKEEEAPAEDDSSKEEEPKEDQSKDESKEETKDEDKDDSKDDKKDDSKDDKKEESKDDNKDDGDSGSSYSNTPKEGESKSKATTEGKNMPENKGDVEGVSFKGPTKEGDEDSKMPDERKRESDSKGAYKKRIDSGYGKNLGEGPAHRDDGSESAATAKEPQKGKEGEISSKQFGLSTTQTRHSTDITQDPNMSKKGEGSPETAKSQGTVSVNRPMPEAKKGETKENMPRPEGDDK